MKIQVRIVDDTSSVCPSCQLEHKRDEAVFGFDIPVPIESIRDANGAIDNRRCFEVVRDQTSNYLAKTSALKTLLKL